MAAREYSVENIIQRKLVCGRAFYLIKWLDYSDCTWEPIENINIDCVELLEEIEVKQAHKIIGKCAPYSICKKNFNVHISSWHQLAYILLTNMKKFQLLVAHIFSSNTW